MIPKSPLRGQPWLFCFILFFYVHMFYKLCIYSTNIKYIFYHLLVTDLFVVAENWKQPNSITIGHVITRIYGWIHIIKYNAAIRNILANKMIYENANKNIVKNKQLLINIDKLRSRKVLIVLMSGIYECPFPWILTRIKYYQFLM